MQCVIMIQIMIYYSIVARYSVLLRYNVLLRCSVVDSPGSEIQCDIKMPIMRYYNTLVIACKVASPA